MKKISLQENLYYLFFSPNAYSENQTFFVDATYNLWRKNWFGLFNQIDQTDLACSDEFTRQTDIGAIFFNKECVGSVGFRRVDLTKQFGRDDSYIKVWPPDVLNRVLEKQSYLWIISGFNIERKFATRVCNLPSVWLFGSLVNHRIQEINTQFAATISRNDVGVNKLCQRQGAEMITQKILFHGKECDLFLYHDLPNQPWDKYSTVFSQFYTHNRWPKVNWSINQDLEVL